MVMLAVRQDVRICHKETLSNLKSDVEDLCETCKSHTALMFMYVRYKALMHFGLSFPIASQLLVVVPMEPVAVHLLSVLVVSCVSAAHSMVAATGLACKG